MLMDEIKKLLKLLADRIDLEQTSNLAQRPYTINANERAEQNAILCAYWDTLEFGVEVAESNKSKKKFKLIAAAK